jgi:hypothetical protein
LWIVQLPNSSRQCGHHSLGWWSIKVSDGIDCVEQSMANVVFPESEGTFLAWPHPVDFSCGQAASVPTLDLRYFMGIQLPA